MSSLLLKFWALLSAAIRHVGGRAQHAVATRLASPTRTPETDEADFDPQRLSRARLLCELLAPAPCISMTKISQACDASPRQTLPVALEAAVTRRLQAARELLCRQILNDLRGRPMMDSPMRLAEWLGLHCATLDYEVFLVIYLDAQHRLITIEQLFRGTLTQTSVYPREVVKAALKHNAAAVALAHNHPSGVPNPSRADQSLTETLKSALSLVDIRVIDHFIVAGAQHYSFAEHGLI